MSAVAETFYGSCLKIVVQRDAIVGIGAAAQATAGGSSLQSAASETELHPAPNTTIYYTRM